MKRINREHIDFLIRLLFDKRHDYETGGPLRQANNPQDIIDLLAHLEKELITIMEREDD